jgi:chlorite dismutase
MRIVDERLAVAFVGGASGAWRVETITAIIGDGLAAAARLSVVEGANTSLPSGVAWVLRGLTSNERYVKRREREALARLQPRLGRTEATHAALIPMTKSLAWWDLAQDERRAIFEERSRHIATGMQYLPAVARRLHHGSDLGEPFDFLTWFEYAPANAPRFDELVGMLRETEEWRYVEREVDIRLTRLPYG